MDLSTERGLSVVLHAIPGITLSGNVQEQPGGQQRDNLDVTASLWCKRSAICIRAWPYQLPATSKKPNPLPFLCPDKVSIGIAFRAKVAVL